MRRSEHLWDGVLNKEQHRFAGPIPIPSITPTKQQFSLRKHMIQPWRELIDAKLPYLDRNAGNPLGIGELQERNQSYRIISAAVYSLESVTVLTKRFVEKVLTEKNVAGSGAPRAVGVRLADGSEIRGQEIIVAAGALRSP